jgi:hypothetical protein
LEFIIDILSAKLIDGMRMSNLYFRVRALFLKGGRLRTLVREALVSLRLYDKSIVYIIEVEMKERNESDFMPKINNFTFKILTNKSQIDELINNNFKLVYKPTKIKNRLERGAIGFCIFIEKELVSIDWVGMTEVAKKAFNDYPYKVDYANRQASKGGSWTNPKFRNMGLATYLRFKEEQFLIDKGVIKHRCIIETNNIPAIKAHEKASQGEDYIICARAVYLRILGLRFWKETALPLHLRS